MIDMITIASYSTPIEAEIAKGRLRENGVEAILKDNATSSFIGLAGFSFDIQIHEKDALRAKRILKELFLEDKHEEFKLKCPKCESCNVRSSVLMKIIGRIIPLNICMLLSIFPNICLECGFKWHERKKDIKKIEEDLY